MRAPRLAARPGARPARRFAARPGRGRAIRVALLGGLLLAALARPAATAAETTLRRLPPTGPVTPTGPFTPIATATPARPPARALFAAPLGPAETATPPLTTALAPFTPPGADFGVDFCHGFGSSAGLGCGHDYGLDTDDGDEGDEGDGGSGRADGEISDAPRYEVGARFDRGVFVRATDPRRDPYSLYVGARLQLRHTGFVRDDETWTDQAGVTRDILNRNNFDTERARLNISGTAVDPDLSYVIVLDGDADGESIVDAISYFLTYEFAESLRVRFGRWKVAAHREWLLSSRFLQLTDRSLATDFFRVDFSDGVWLLGDLGEGLHYEASLTNGLRTSTRPALSLDDNLGVAATFSWDPLGPYGRGDADYANHAEPVVRVGASFAFTKSDDRGDVGEPLGDDNLVRLTDGTLLADVGALAPGVQLLGDRIYLASIDFGLKHRGWSCNGEVYFRSLRDFTADGPLPVESVDDHGFRAVLGKFLVPQRLDVSGRVSSIGGLFGDAWEYALGLNYYWGSHRNERGELDDRVNKLSFDVTELKGTPITSPGADLIAGDDGVLFRTQLQWAF